MRSEVNLSDHYRRDLVEVFSKFSKYNDNKSFKVLKRSDVIAFLESFRRTETQDPLHKWIGTYNIYRIHLMRFFKWLYNPDSQLKRKEKSIYKPSDLWTQQDDLLFLKFCPSKRDKCYHAISRDSSCRPHEIVKLNVAVPPLF